MSRDNSSQALLRYLQANGPTPSSELTERFGISRPTLSRRVQELGPVIVAIGKGRATQLAARHKEVTTPTPLYFVDEKGQVSPIGQLTSIQAGEHTQWLLEPEGAPNVFFEGEFKNGLYPGWPWFLEDLRPSGFLGRAFGKRMARLFQIDEKPEAWSDLELLTALSGFGSNLPGNLILDDGSALEDFQKQKLKIAQGDDQYITPAAYPELAERALTEGERYGSSAAGEQPKFTTLVGDPPDSTPRSVIVKFSPRLDTPVGQRWSDLLHAEYLANQVLNDAGFETACLRLHRQADRCFLESERFDRVGSTGRRGLVTLRTLDAAHLGLGRGTWTDAARKLHVGKWITEEDCRRIIQLHCFGQLIANTDMHWGNLSFFLPEASPYPLAPVYDMLPMFFRPSETGEVVEREFKPSLPKPEHEDTWLEMHPLAIDFWQRAADHKGVSKSFQALAGASVDSLRRILPIVRGA